MGRDETVRRPPHNNSPTMLCWASFSGRVLLCSLLLPTIRTCMDVCRFHASCVSKGLLFAPLCTLCMRAYTLPVCSGGMYVHVMLRAGPKPRLPPCHILRKLGSFRARDCVDTRTHALAQQPDLNQSKQPAKLTLLVTPDPAGRSCHRVMPDRRGGMSQQAAATDESDVFELGEVLVAPDGPVDPVDPVELVG